MNVQWFKHLGPNPSQGDKEELRQQLVRHSDTLEILQKILEGKLNLVVPSSDYSDPSASLRQADRNGYNRALLDIIKLIAPEG